MWKNLEGQNIGEWANLNQLKCKIMASELLYGFYTSKGKCDG